MNQDQYQPLDLDHSIKSIVALCYMNERPLQGLAGHLDWRFHGAISYFLRQGALTGREGECVYIPVRKHERVFHLLMVGAGMAVHPGARDEAPEEVFESLRKNLPALKLPQVGVSAADFGGLSAAELEKKLKGAELCLLP
ncbi:MAG: hypothetical protein AB7P04_14690 [Bacteriovoracia bacterium]